MSRSSPTAAHASASVLPSRSSSHVMIEVRRHCAAMPVDYLPVIRHAMETTWHRWEASGPRGHRGFVERVEHYVVSGDLLIFQAGLVDRVAEALADAGYDVEVADRTVWIALERAEPRATTGLREDERHFLARVLEMPRAQLRYGTLSERDRRIALLCDALPLARILVIAKNNRNAIDIRRLLRCKLSDGDRLSMNPPAERATTGVIHATTSYWFSLADPDDWDVLIFTEPESALAKQSLDRLTLMGDQLRYCAVPHSYAAGSRTRFQFEELFGQPLNEQQDDHAAHVAVLSVPYGKPGNRVRTMAAMQRKRLHIWHAPSRCRLVAHLGKKIAEGQVADLHAMGLSIPEWLQVGEDIHDVAILVEAPEHGRELLSQLPGWQLLHDSPSISDEQTDYYLPVTDQSVVTASYAQLYGVSSDVLIWAGGAHWPLTEDVFPRPALNQDDRVLLIDIADQHDTRLREAARRRLDMYREMGWAVLRPLAD